MRIKVETSQTSLYPVTLQCSVHLIGQFDFKVYIPWDKRPEINCIWARNMPAQLFNANSTLILSTALIYVKWCICIKVDNWPNLWLFYAEEPHVFQQKQGQLLKWWIIADMMWTPELQSVGCESIQEVLKLIWKCGVWWWLPFTAETSPLWGGYCLEFPRDPVCVQEALAEQAGSLQVCP